jgi:hypothetical protein
MRNISKKNNYGYSDDASEYYHEVEYGEGGVARAKDVIINKIGLNEELADFFVSKSEKFAIWLADSIIKENMSMSDLTKKQAIDYLNQNSSLTMRTLSSRIRGVLDWLQHPVTPKQDLRNLSFSEAEEKAKEWHDELQVLGGDIDFTEPEKNTIIKTYPKNYDGVEYYWVFIPSNYCDLESSRMGHCGRTGFGNTLISLRSIKPYGKGHTLSDSHITIAYGSDGVFYQVKGKKNQKPAEKYFPYIFDLIKSILNGEINERFKKENDESIKVVEYLMNEQKKIQEQILPHINFYLSSPSSYEMKFLKGELNRGDFEGNFYRFLSSQIPVYDNFRIIHKLNEELNVVRNNREYEELVGEINRLREEAYTYYIENVVDKYKEIIRLSNLQKESEKGLMYFQFNGFGSEYGTEEDYGFEDMSNEELRELYELKPDVFKDAESIFALFDASVITVDEVKSISESNPAIFKSFGNKIKLFDRGIISERPSTIIEVEKDCEDVKYLLKIDRDFRDDLVENVLCGDTYELSDSWGYYYENPSDLVSNLNKENTEKVIDEIVRLTGLDRSVITENGIEYYLEGEDEEFDADTFDNITRTLASAQNNADNDDYSNYLYNRLKSSLEELGEVHSLNDEGVKMTIDLSDLMPDDEIADNMERYEFEYVSDLFWELIADNSLALPIYNIDSRYSPYGSSEDFNSFVSDSDLESGYEKGGSLRTKNITKKSKFKNMKPSQKKLAKGGNVGYSKDEYFLVVKNWVYFTFNYPVGFVKSAFDSKHLEDKFSSSYTRYGSIGVLMSFWSNLDNENKRILSVWIKNNYFNSSSEKTELQSISDDNYAKIITHWNMFCFNFPYGFIEKIFGDNTSHFEMKWIRAYESAGSTGAVNKLFTELSGDNQRLFTDWVYDNYSEQKYADGGDVKTNEGILESFLTLNKQTKTNNLSTHYNEYDDEILLRNYGTLIATRKGNQVTITNEKHSKTTTTITNKLKNMALNKRMNVKYTDKFADGGGVSDWMNNPIIHIKINSSNGKYINSIYAIVKGYGIEWDDTKKWHTKGYAIGVYDSDDNYKPTIIFDVRDAEKANELYDKIIKLGNDDNRINVIAENKNIYADKFSDGGEAGEWINYDKDHLMNTETGMIVLKGTNLEDIKSKDVKGFDKLVTGSYASGGRVKLMTLESPYDVRGNFQEFIAKQNILRIMNNVSFRKFGNEFRKHIDKYFTQEMNIEQLNKGMSWSELASYIIGDGNYSVNENQYNSFVNNFPHKYIYDYAKGGGVDLDNYADGGRVKVGVFDENQLRNKEDKKAVEKAQKETGLNYVDTKIIKKGGKMFLEVYLIPNEEYYNSNKFEKGGESDLDYSDILNVLKTKIDDSIDEMPTEFENANSYKGEEIEHTYRDGFIPYTDGGYEAVWFEYLGSMYGTGHNLPTKPLDDEMNRQIEYSYKIAKESFIEKYPEIVEEIGEEKIDYNSLYELGYGDEAEELSEMESESMWEDTIMMRVLANYYSPENTRAVDGKHTIRLFGDVNLESPYHRAGNLDDSYEFEFTFDSIDELEEKMDEGIRQVISWFEGDMYNDSTTEMKVRRMEDGGETDEDKNPQPKIVRQYFEDEEFEYAKGGSTYAEVSSIVGIYKTKSKAEKMKKIFENSRSAKDNNDSFYIQKIEKPNTELKYNLIREKKNAKGGSTYAGGGSLMYIDTKYSLEDAEKYVEKLKKSGEYRRVQARKNVHKTHTSTGKIKKGDSGTFWRIYAEPIESYAGGGSVKTDVEIGEFNNVYDFIEYLENIRESNTEIGATEMNNDYRKSITILKNLVDNKTLSSKQKEYIEFLKEDLIPLLEDSYPMTAEDFNIFVQYVDVMRNSYADGGETGELKNVRGEAFYITESSAKDSGRDFDSLAYTHFGSKNQFEVYLGGAIKVFIFDVNVKNQWNIVQAIYDQMETEGLMANDENIQIIGFELDRYPKSDFESELPYEIEEEEEDEELREDNYAGGGEADDKPKYKKAKSWNDIKNHPLVDDTSVEENDPSEGLDYWVYLAKGYCWESPNSEQHIIHEWGVKDTLREFNNSIYRCNCSECVKEEKFADGGEMKNKSKQPKIVRQYFEEEEIEYGKGGETNWKSLGFTFKTKQEAHDFIENMPQKEFDKLGDLILVFNGEEFILAEITDNNYADGGEVEDWMEEALASLIEETGYDDLEINYVVDSKIKYEFIASDGNVEYRVFQTEGDAQEIAVEQVREDLEVSLESFNQDWLMNFIDGSKFFSEALFEMNERYIEDIESESDSKYSNRLIAELVDNGLMDEEDAESDDAELFTDDLKHDYAVLLTQGQLDEGNDGLDYFISNFGEKETYKMVMDNYLIDIDTASQDAVQTDGIAHFLSSYDGETIYLYNDCVAYRTN